MIRDPSDGTVREPAKEAAKSVIETGISGLATDKLKADEAARLERARDWLKNYFNRE